jgi:hypothetical protein
MYRDKTSGGTKHLVGKNIQRDKTSGTQNIRGDKTSRDITSVGQDIRGNKKSGGTKCPNT